MKTSFSFRLPGRITVQVGPLRTRYPGHRSVCCGFRRVRVSDPYGVWSDAQNSLTDPRKLRRAYRRAYDQGTRYAHDSPIRSKR